MRAAIGHPFSTPTSTNLTHAFPSAGRAASHAVGLALVERVTVLAHLLAGALGCLRVRAIEKIFSLRHCFQVSWIDAQRLTAQMVDHKAIAYWPVVKFVTKSVCVSPPRRGAATVDCEHAVPTVVATDPHPTAIGLVNEAPKADFGRGGSWSSGHPRMISLVWHNRRRERGLITEAGS